MRVRTASSDLAMYRNMSRRISVGIRVTILAMPRHNFCGNKTKMFEVASDRQETMCRIISVLSGRRIRSRYQIQVTIFQTTR